MSPTNTEDGYLPRKEKYGGKEICPQSQKKKNSINETTCSYQLYRSKPSEVAMNGIINTALNRWFARSEAMQ